MNKQTNQTNLIVTTALITALVLICTLLLRIPCGPDCYVHLGDTVILLAVMILPRKHACFAATIGATLADLLGGFAFWAPWTFFVKLLMVLVFGFFIDRIVKSDSGKAHKLICGLPSLEFVGIVLACVVGVAGYFVSEMILFGNWVGALACIGFNTVQVVVDAVVAVLISNTLYQSQIANTAYYHRPK